MGNLMLEIYDLVSIQGEVGTWTIMGIGTEEPKYRVQLGQDGALIKYVNSANLTLVQKANKLENDLALAKRPPYSAPSLEQFHS